MPFGEYEHLFGENMAGSARLTGAMKKELQKAHSPAWTSKDSKARQPRDILTTPWYDLREKTVFQFHKKEIKARTVLYEHFAPPCQTFSSALAQYRKRFKGRPYGEGQYDEKLDEHTKICIYTCGLARAKHEVGDFFSIEHIWPTEMVNLSCYEELIGLPGVYVLTFDNCRYEEVYRHRQCLITNAPWLMWLSRDCPGGPEHYHGDQIGFGKANSTKDVSAYAHELVETWARLFVKFLRGHEQSQLCPWCAHAHGGGRPLYDKKGIAEIVANDRIITRASWEFDEAVEESASEMIVRRLRQSLKDAEDLSLDAVQSVTLSVGELVNDLEEVHEGTRIVKLDIGPVGGAECRGNDGNQSVPVLGTCNDSGAEERSRMTARSASRGTARSDLPSPMLHVARAQIS